MSQPVDARQYAPATQRNREPILHILQQVLPSRGTVLEISSGTGEHAVFLAPRLRSLTWITSDPDPTARASITAWQTECKTDNLYGPLVLDVREVQWPVEQDPLPELLRRLNLQQQPIAAIVNINMIHIAPWSACLGLMAGAERILPAGGVLYLYGPFKQNAEHTAPSNAAFDASLQARNPQWGVRDLAEVSAIAQQHQLDLLKTVTMPANNLSVVFQRR
ncbi:MAG: DUF938 domain-containing protein [Leptolyngbyaceae cyanobacterium SM1_1_3]|nr:DUF938 domain-containing protein [Leptolyngbyaceae cyanobacterium SM1_1_3]NJN01800.1 DUF938 domain-containing protein [Leptolyngbyaceae cyanobacterium RM1_1_2]NJO11338.1 DUF938 domain-containing protein [Leptolyngbyaceae cyanobacterium SL_1_1]